MPSPRDPVFTLPCDALQDQREDKLLIKESFLVQNFH